MFSRLIGDGKFWIYYHPAHVKMSSVTLAQVLDCGIVSDVTEIESATCTCGTHDELQSYFYDNCRLLQLFRLQLAQCFDETKYQSLCSTIEKLENILNYKWPHENTPFETPGVPTLSSFLFKEDDWTK